MVQSLLPDYRSQFEAELEQATARLGAVPVAIETLNQPGRVAAAFLPFVAAGLSVDVWPKSWNDAQRQVAIATSLPLHMVKGTPYAITEYVRQAGGVVKAYLRPPGEAFAGQSFRGEQRAAWLAHYPQLRIYPYRGHINRPWQFFAAASHAGVRSGPRRRYAMPSTAAARAGRRAVLNDRGVETALNVSVTARLSNAEVLIEREAIHLRTLRPYAFATRFLLRKTRFAGSGTNNSNTVRLTPSQAYGAIKLDRVRQIVSPGLIPIDPTPVEVFTFSNPPPRKFFTGRGSRRFVGVRSFAYPSRAFLHIYDVIWLYRPGVNVAPRRGRFFTNVSRLGVAASHAEVRVKLRRKGPARKLYAGGFAGFDHAYPRDTTLLDDTLRAMRSAKSLRDQIDIDLNCTDVIRASSRILAGDTVCGIQVETI